MSDGRTNWRRSPVADRFHRKKKLKLTSTVVWAGLSRFLSFALEWCCIQQHETGASSKAQILRELIRKAKPAWRFNCIIHARIFGEITSIGTAESLLAKRQQREPQFSSCASMSNKRSSSGSSCLNQDIASNLIVPGIKVKSRPQSQPIQFDFCTVTDTPSRMKPG